MRLAIQQKGLSNEWGGYISHVDQLFPGGAKDFRRKVK